MKKLLFAGLAAAAFKSTFAAGFGIYEASARGNAMGGALVGSTRDASAAYYNPANVTEITNVSFLVGVTFINPFCDAEVDGRSQTKMNPGWFAVPTVYYTIPLPLGFTFSGGNYCEFGLGTKYGNHWDLAGDTVETTMEQYTFNPNLSRKLTDWWSLGAGLRVSYITFNNKKRPYSGDSYATPLGVIPNAYNLHSELDGDDVSLGYNIGSQFKLLDNLSLGVVYRSHLKHKIQGTFNMSGSVVGMHQYAHLPASAKLELPQSLSVGLNWDATETWRFGTVATWTDWSSVDNIKFVIPRYGYSLPLKWKDAWRFGFGAEHDITDTVALRASYIYDMDPSGSHGTTMLPAGDRHIIGTGVGWNIWRTLRLDIGYSFIIMERSSRDVYLTSGLTGQRYSKHFSADNSYSHLVSASLSYTF